MIKRNYKRDATDALRKYGVREQVLGELIHLVDTPIPNDETGRKKITEEIKKILEKEDGKYENNAT